MHYDITTVTISDGYEVAVMKAVDELLPQYEFEFVGTTDDDLLIGVESGKYDVGTKGVWWTAERSEKYVFPEHYIGTSIIGIAIRAEDADEITDLESFAKYSGSLVPIGAQNAQYDFGINFLWIYCRSANGNCSFYHRQRRNQTECSNL